jgi:hypothetical protein
MKQFSLNARHVAGVLCFVLALAAHGFGPSYPQLAPFASILVYVLTSIGVGILGGAPAWYTRLNPTAPLSASELPTKPELVPSVRPIKPVPPPLPPAAALGLVLGLCTIVMVACAAFTKDEPIVAADITRATNDACAADALADPIAAGVLTPASPVTVALTAVRAACPALDATDAELSAFASTLIAKHAAKVDAGAVDAGAGG